MDKKFLIFLVSLTMISVFVGCSAGKKGADKSKFIGEQRAKEIAIEKAGVPVDGVIFDRVTLEMDDGVWKYEVEFKKDYTEYDAEIKAIDGTVLKWEIDTN